MRIFCLERDNVTQPSDPDSKGDEYTVSFELYPFHEGASYSYFKGLMNGEGPLRGSFCVVRAMLDTVAEARNWSDMMRRATEAQRLAQEFNKYLGYDALTIQVPMLTQIDTLSDFAFLFRCAKPHDKRLKLGEFVTVEPFLDGAFLKFNSCIGHSTSESKNRNCIDANSGDENFGGSDASFKSYRTRLNSTSLIQAFSHFTWHFTKNLVVCGLQGVNNRAIYTLTNPTIHSTDSKFGQSDGSTPSIAEFFSSHHCNNICCKWETCGSTGKSQRYVNFCQNSEYSNANKEYTL